MINVEQEVSPDDAVCRECGHDELASIERSVDWQRVVYVKGEEGFEVDSESWGDIVGDSTSETIGVACIGCDATTYEEEEGATGTAIERAIVTRADFEATHPVLRWRVSRQRLIGNSTWMIASDTPDPLDGDRLYWSNDQGWVDRASADRFVRTDRDLPDGGCWVFGDPPPHEDGEIEVMARTRREALEKGHEYGMIDGKYPWRAASAEEIE
ncbi:MAG: hypothetical protein ACOYB2_10965 [Limnohabitans sp.]